MDNDFAVGMGTGFESRAEESGLDSAATIETGEQQIGEIRSEQVVVARDGISEPAYDDTAAAELVWANYNLAKNYLEQNSWLLDWQAIDYYYQNQNNDRWLRPADGRPVRIARYIIAKNANTMDNQVHRSVWGNQKPFALQPEGDTSEMHLQAWTHIIWLLLKRSKAEYNFGLAGECSRLFGTGILQPGWEVRKVKKKKRKRIHPEPVVNLPDGQTTVATERSDEFKEVSDIVEESWPFLEFKPLGTALFDPKWSTPNAPEESAGYVIDFDTVNFQDLQQLRDLPCYKKIPDDEALKKYFFDNPEGQAPAASEVARQQQDQSSLAMHAKGPEAKTSASPLDREMMLLSQWTGERVITILCCEGKRLTIRNDEHDMGDHALHYAFNWWNVPKAGWGIGIGKINLDDQRMDTGVLNEVLKMIGLWFNTPLLIRRGENPPTQNVISGLANFLQVDTGPDGDVRKSIGYIERPQIPGEAWRIMDMALHGGEDVVGANSTTMQGNLGGAGSSAMRTAAGVNRVGGKADENISKPVQFESMALERFIYFLIDQVRLKMPLQEIRDILRKKYAKEIVDEIDMEVFLDAAFMVDVLAGQRLMAKQAIQQLIPFILQILQQPTIQQYYNAIGMKLDYAALFSILIRMSELDGNIDNIFVPMTPRERAMYKQNSPGAQKVQGQLAVESQRGKNKLEEVAARTEGEQQTELVKAAAKRLEGSTQLENAEGRLERNTDMGILQNGVGA